jgi:gluconokinase
MDAGERPQATSVVVMGVSGSGKSTIAAGLVQRLGWEFAEGDDFHPPENVEKMRAGIGLTDEDRWPWLRRLAEWIGEHERAGTSCIITCSALKRTYRDLLCDGHPSTWYVHVFADPDLIKDRMEHRSGHYMPVSLLDSQLATLEPLGDDEPGVRISGAGSPETVLEQVLSALSKERGVRIPDREVSP